jgi:hypothetical protein
MVSEPTRWLLYYGGADKYVGVVSTQLKYSEIKNWQSIPAPQEGVLSLPQHTAHRLANGFLR